MEEARQHPPLGAARLAGIAGAAALAWATAAAAEGEVRVPVPSGQEVTWIDTIQGAPGPAGLTVRFRFLAPAIARLGGTVTAEEAQADMEALCNTFALPRLPAIGPVPRQIVISLSDRVVPFGEANPDATQFFEAFSVEDGVCMVEVF